jgi:lysozyme
MKVSAKGIDLVKRFEGCKLKAYADPVGIWTIGYGTIRYPNGQKVKQGDIITQVQAEEYLMHELNTKGQQIQHHFYNTFLTQNKIDAILSFTYNLGVGALGKSTLLKKIKANPNDQSIELEFMKWVRAGGKVLNGLVKRRQAESDLYFT